MTSKENRLGKEKSPYLLQHKNNPVNWYPWGEEAFQAARDQNKLIFLSIGYSTCYWCHVMEKDSFEIQEVADALNQDFISVKVDREEHPDVDQIYMDAVIGMTGQGGWPMSVFLTPDLKPFFGGTFFPRAQFLALLSRMQNVWRSEPDKVSAAGQQLVEYLTEKNKTAPTRSLSVELLREAYRQFDQGFDERYGGFGTAPKFPPSTGISLLLRIHHRTGNNRALEMATKTLDEMARGGIFDHVGGGFHRYSTDAEWRIPHYEKMLYDNALLTSTYLEAYQITHSELYSKTARQTLDYLLREMTDPEGGFYSAQDAGEVGKEGEYYHLNKEERSKSSPPHKDDKVLTSWNGLMIAAMAKGYQVLGNEKYLAAAQKAARFIQTRLASKHLMRRYRDGDARYAGTLDDYAFLIHGLIFLYESDFDTHWISWARELQKKQDELFWDPQGGGYFLSDAADSSLIIRKKEVNDGAIPSGNSIAALNLLRLAGLTYEGGYREKANRLLEVISGEASQYPAGYAQGLVAIDYRLDRSKEIAVVGKQGDSKLAEVVKTIHQEFIPNKALAVGEASFFGLPLLQGKTMIDGKPTLYVCENQTCKLPTNDWAVAKKLIREVEKYDLP